MPDAVPAHNAGLRVQAERDTGTYPTKVKVADEALAAVQLTPHAFHGDWNYTITPTHLMAPV